MQPSTSMFTPIPLADGGYFGVIPGTFTPDTYAVTANDFGLPVEMQMPAFATGIILQAVTDVQYYTDQESAATGALPLTLSAGSYMRMQGADAVGKLCIVIGASTSFVLQYTQGEGGVPPAFFLASQSGGITPPPPPGIGAIPTINVVHVMKNSGGQGGNDATAARNRLDLPALTIAHAQTLAQPGDTIVVWTGIYQEGDLGADGVTYMLINASIEASEGAGHASAFTADAIAFIITGSGSISYDSTDGAAVLAFSGSEIIATGVEINATDQASGIYASGASVVRWTGYINSQRVGVWASDATIEVTGRVASSQFYGVYTDNAAAVVTINGNALSEQHYGALCNAGTMTINGTATSNSTTGQAAAECNNGQLVLTGSCIATGLGIGANMNGTGTMIVRGDATAVDGPGSKCAAGTLTVYGTSSSESNYGWFATGGTSNIEGPVNAPNSTAIYVQGSPVVRVKNNVNGAGGAGITIQTLTADVQLYASCYIESGAESVLGDVGSPVPIRSYGASGNSATSDVTVTGTFNVVP